MVSPEILVFFTETIIISGSLMARTHSKTMAEKRPMEIIQSVSHLKRAKIVSDSKITGFTVVSICN